MPGSMERASQHSGPAVESGVAPGRADGRRVLSLAQRVGRWLVLHGTDLLFGVLALALLAAIAYDTFYVRLATATRTGDFWEHSATVRELMEHPWHPENPHLKSSDPSPRFIPLFLLVALVGRSFELDVLDTMGIVALTHGALFLVGIFVFFRTYFRARRASLYGLVVMFGSWIYAWHFSNVYQLSIFFSVVSYPSTAALGISMLGFTQTTRLLRGAARERIGLPLLAVCIATLLITHALTAMMGIAGAGLLCLTEPAVPWKRRLRVIAAIGLGALAAEAWPYFSTFITLRGGAHQETSWVADLMDQDFQTWSGPRHFFYKKKDLILAVGYALVGLPVCVLLLALRRHLFIVLGAVAMLTPFTLNYLWVELPLGHRFILLAIFFLQAALVWLLLTLPGFVGRVLRPVVKVWPERVMTLGVFAFLFWIIQPNVNRALARFDKNEQRNRGGMSPTVRVAHGIARAAGKNAVILADAETAWALPTFGPKVVSLLHENPLVPDERKRNGAVRYFFSARSNDQSRRETLQTYKVTHVVVRNRQEKALQRFLGELGTRRALPGGYVLYTLASNAD